MATSKADITLGDTLTPLGRTLKQRDANNVLAGVNLTGKTVKFMMVAEDGTVVVSETATGVTVTDAVNGKVQYDFQSSDVAAITAKGAGTYYGWFRVYVGTEFDTFPKGGRKFAIVVSAAT